MKHLVWYNQAQFCALLLMAAAMPLSFHIGIWTAALLALTSTVKLVAERHIGNPSLTTAGRVALLAPIAYVALLAASLLWSSDLQTGMDTLWLKATLLVAPLCLLLTDTSYLSSGHLRAMGYALLLAVVGVFLWFAGRAGLHMLEGSTFAAVTGISFDPRHHSYTALYATVCMAFVYREMTAEKHRKGLLVAMAVAMAMLVCYVVLVNSRAGMLAMGMTLAACVLHFAFTRRRLWLTLAVAVAAAGLVTAATQLLPGYTDRLSTTLENVQNDARTKITRGAWETAKENLWIGQGVGDYRERLVANDEATDFESGGNARYNAHNQYMESLVSTGMVGLATLLAMLLAPLWATCKGCRREWFFVALCTAIVMLNLLFESMLERQMGLIFIGFLLAALSLVPSRRAQ